MHLRQGAAYVRLLRNPLQPERFVHYSYNWWTHLLGIRWPARNTRDWWLFRFSAICMHELRTHYCRLIMHMSWYTAQHNWAASGSRQQSAHQAGGWRTKPASHSFSGYYCIACMPTYYCQGRHCADWRWSCLGQRMSGTVVLVAHALPAARVRAWFTHHARMMHDWLIPWMAYLDAHVHVSTPIHVYSAQAAVGTHQGERSKPASAPLTTAAACMPKPCLVWNFFFYKMDIVAFLFLFDKYCPIIG